jgi:hypothetical protein
LFLTPNVSEGRHIGHPSTWDAEPGGLWEFGAILSYIVSSKLCYIVRPCLRKEEENKRRRRREYGKRQMKFSMSVLLLRAACGPLV